MSSGKSISFDRAAPFYDATRRLPEALAAAVNDAILAVVREEEVGHVLEIGIGTGRIARPLMATGVRVTGVDISARMMSQLHAQLGPGHTPPDLLLGDATRLPFRDGAFRLALAVHVFHLVSDLALAISEARRVLGLGGVLLQEFHRGAGETRQAWTAHERFWDEALARRGFKRRPRPQPEDIDRALAESGAVLTPRVVAEADEASTVTAEVERVRNRIMSWTWEIPDDLLDACLPEYEAFLHSIADTEGRLPGRAEYVVQTVRWPG